MLMASVSFAPLASAEDQVENNTENQAIKEIVQTNSRAAAYEVSATEQTTVTTAAYKQQLPANVMHEYLFTSSGGSFTVKANHQDPEENIEYLIYDFNTEEVIEPTTSNSFNLVEGVYILLVMNIGDVTQGYDYSLDGPFKDQPDTELPDLQVTSPTQASTRLPYGSASEFTVNGTSTGTNVKLLVNGEEVDLVAPGAFSYKVNLENGINDIMVRTMKAGGNSVTSHHEVTLPGVTRIIGSNRYEVSSNISATLDYWGGNSGTVIIARGDMFPDALAGGPLAATEGAPILLTGTKSLPVAVQEEIQALGAERAIILGGTGSVSTAVEEELADLGVTEIERIAGKDRFAVAAGVAEQVSAAWESDTAIIASGMVFPDALSASGIAGVAGMPILPVKSDSVPDAIQNFIADHPEIENFIVVGGPATVKASVLAKIDEITDGNAYIERISGKDRYEVAINVAKFGLEYFDLDLSTVTVARGDLFPDALSGAPLANYFNAPILLTSTSKLEDKVNTFLTSQKGKMDHIYILGGTGSVSINTENQLKGLLQ